MFPRCGTAGFYAIKSLDQPDVLHIGFALVLVIGLVGLSVRAAIFMGVLLSGGVRVLPPESS